MKKKYIYLFIIITIIIIFVFEYINIYYLRNNLIEPFRPRVTNHNNINKNRYKCNEDDFNNNEIKPTCEKDYIPIYKCLNKDDIKDDIKILKKCESNSKKYSSLTIANKHIESFPCREEPIDRVPSKCNTDNRLVYKCIKKEDKEKKYKEWKSEIDKSYQDCKPIPINSSSNDFCLIS